MPRCKIGHIRGNTQYYHYRQGVSLQRFSKQSVVRHTSLITVFCFVTLLSAALFSAIGMGDNLPAQSRHLTTRAATGKPEVTGPGGSAATAADIRHVLGVAALTVSETTPAAVPPKPSWVYLPLYTDPSNGATQYVASNPQPTGIAYITRMSQVPVAEWFGDWNADVTSDVNSYVSAAAAKGSVPVVVAYNIPNRDCGGYSVGGASDLSNYTQWVQKVAAGIGNRTAVVILEPDALGALDCLPASAQSERTQSLAKAVDILKAHINTAVYIDAGTPVWQPADVMAQRLKSADVAAADGFSLNVSYFATTSSNRAYGDKLSRLVGYKHYVIDTSRNGGNHAVTGMQCNPSFAALGQTPTTDTGDALNDALLWIKIPWESDGQCNGSPGPGVEYWSYAIQLAKNAGW